MQCNIYADSLQKIRNSNGMTFVTESQCVMRICPLANPRFSGELLTKLPRRDPCPVHF